VQIVARFAQLRRACTCSATGLPHSTAKNPIFDPISGKNDPHIRIPAAFPGSGWSKISGKNNLDLKPFGGLLARCNFASFWQTERYSGIFFTLSETDDFTGFSGSGQAKRSPN
jgi:hypothetical protein